MPEVSLADTIITSLNAQEPWPDNVKLFQPYEVEQILLPDNASCLAVQAFLKMCNLPFEVEMRWNAEFMSPSGRVPFIKCGAFVVSELEPIVQFAANKGVTLCSKLSTEERAEMRAYMSLITNVLVNAELYISWVDQETFNTVTRVRNSSVYPWPLGWLQTRSKRSSVIKRLKALHWHDKTLDQVLADVEQCCNSLSQQLGDKDYFFGTPTPLDALIFGHMKALLSTNGPKAALMIKPITNTLLRHFLRMSNITQIKLSHQEEYLVSQAAQLSRRSSPTRSISRIKRSKLSIRNTSRDNLVYIKDMYGFKPFASKQIIVMTSKEGKITCEQSNKNKACIINNENCFIIDIINEIIEKADELANKIDEYNENNDGNEFEVIAYTNENFERKHDFLDTIDENSTDVTVSDVVEDEIQVIDVVDSDGIVTDKLIDCEDVMTASLNTSGVNLVESGDDSDIEEVDKKLSVYDVKTPIPSPTRSVSKSKLFINASDLRHSALKTSPVLTFEISEVRTKENVARIDTIHIRLHLLVKRLNILKLMLFPTELDALVFGHVFTIITTRLPCRRLADTVRRHDTLVALAKRIDEQYFKRP